MFGLRRGALEREALLAAAAPATPSPLLLRVGPPPAGPPGPARPPAGGSPAPPPPQERQANVDAGRARGTAVGASALLDRDVRASAGVARARSAARRRSRGDAVVAAALARPARERPP